MTFSPSPVRAAELMASLSVASDLAMGQPADFSVTTCVLTMRLGDALGLDDQTLQDAYYESLLRYVGCNAGVEWFASLFGDELAFRAEYAILDTHDIPGLLDLIRRSVRRSAAVTRIVGADAAVERAMAEIPTVLGSFLPGHCEVARRLSARMGFGESFVNTVGQIYARWDGQGTPSTAGEAIAPAYLCAALAHDAATHYRLGGLEAALAMARARSGGQHSPQMVEVFCARAPSLLRGLERPPNWKDVIALEPGTRRMLDDDALDASLEVVADFSDLKLPAFLGHSRGVATLAGRAGEVFGLPAADVRLLRRAALVHDIGKVGVTSEIWGSDQLLSDREREAMQLHPYHTGRVFSRSESLSAIGSLASMHHERLDGSGYYRNLPAAMQPVTVRILSAANRFRSLVEARPHREALPPEAAARQLRADASSRALDEDAVAAVLTAAGERVSWRNRTASAALTEREVEVLRLMARGQTMKAAASQLEVAYKTVDRHVQNIYLKIGVSTRAGATLWAVEHGLT